MGFQLYPTTLNHWANYFMTKWDIYARANPCNSSLLIPNRVDHTMRPLRLPLFKTENMEDYQRFRSVMQVIDLSILDLNYLSHEKL